MKHYSFQNGIGIGVGILSSKNREKFSKKLINENSKVNNKKIQEKILLILLIKLIIKKIKFIHRLQQKKIQL